MEDEHVVGGRSLAAAGLHCQQGLGTECSACVLARPRYVVIRYTRRLHSYALSVLLLYRHGPPSMPDSAVLAPSARALAMAVNRRKMRARRAWRAARTPPAGTSTPSPTAPCDRLLVDLSHLITLNSSTGPNTLMC